MPSFPAPAARGVAGNLAAGAAAGAVVLQLALAQVTLALATAFLIVAALTRWRPAWLLVPAVAGLCWIAVVGAARAGAGYLAGAGHLVSVVTGNGSLAGRLSGLGPAAAGWRRWLPAQFPVALVVAAAETCVVARWLAAPWLAAPGLAAGRSGARGPYRPGLLVAARRGYVRASLRRGEVATADGGCLGVIADTGRRAAVSWREAGRGVLVTGLDPGAVAGTCLDLAAAAILHRKSTLIIDLTSGAITGCRRGGRGAATVPWSVRGAVAAACSAAGAPAAVLGQGRDRYEPFSEAGPAGAAGLLVAMTGLAEAGHAGRAFCAEYAQAAFEVIAMGAGGTDACTAATAGHLPAGILGELAVLLRSGALQERLSHAAGHGADPELRRRVAALTSHAKDDTLARLGERLATLRHCAAGALLSEPAAGADTATISLARALAERQVVLFPLDPRAHGAGGVMVARLVVADLARVLAGRAEVRQDCLLWINGCEALDAGGLAAVLEAGQAAGLATMLSTADAAAAAALAARLNVIVLRGRPPNGLTGAATWSAAGAGLPGETLLCHEDSDVLPARMLAAGGADALSILVRAPVPRFVTGGRVVR